MADEQGSLFSRLIIMGVGGIVVLLGLYSPDERSGGSASLRGAGSRLFGSLSADDLIPTKSKRIDSGLLERSSSSNEDSGLSWRDRLAKIFDGPTNPLSDDSGLPEQRGRLATPDDSPLEQLDHEPEIRVVGKAAKPRATAKNSELLARDAPRDTLTEKDRKQLNKLLGDI